eukprot:GEZU01006544.1.p1 GENE.GEZU01006544.1~~GEZU01006544.1.p1  ORF type:complete len:139 (-),score=27.70 GEZU01006544.1:61-477(-)
MSSPDNSTDNEEAKFHKILLSDAELWQQQRQRFFMEQERKHKYKQKQQQQQSETNDNEEPKSLPAAFFDVLFSAKPIGFDPLYGSVGALLGLGVGLLDKHRRDRKIQLYVTKHPGFKFPPSLLYAQVAIFGVIGMGCG